MIGSNTRQKVGIYLSKQEIATLDNQAASKDITRGELIRIRALSPASSTSPINATIRQDPKLYSRCVEAAARSIPGIPRTQLEALVAKVIITLHANA